MQWAVTDFEFLVPFSAVLRYVLPFSISLPGRCMDILTAMTDDAIDECQLNMGNLGVRTWMVYRAYDCQILLDATGESTSGDN